MEERVDGSSKSQKLLLVTGIRNVAGYSHQSNKFVAYLQLGFKVHDFKDIVKNLVLYKKRPPLLRIYFD